jgi:hypothetical protein
MHAEIMWLGNNRTMLNACALQVHHHHWYRPIYICIKIYIYIYIYMGHFFVSMKDHFIRPCMVDAAGQTNMHEFSNIETNGYDA